MDAPWRRDCLGGSDAPALVGVDPFRTAGDVWAEKTGRLPMSTADSETEIDPKTLGTALGPLLVDYAARRLGKPVAAEVYYRHPSAPMGCSVDGICFDPGVLIEAKTTGILGPAHPQIAPNYGDDGTDEVPESVLIQTHHSLAVLDAQPDVPRIGEILVPVLIGGRGLRCYRIVRDDALVTQLLELETDWWTQYVEGDRCPPDDPPSLTTLRRMERKPDAPTRVVDNTYVAEWQQAKAVLKQAEKIEEMSRRLVLADLGDGEIGECALGRLTYRAVHRAAYTVAPSIVRTLRFTPHRERQVA
jgi:predicted phage-related endonuclease